MLTRRHFWRPLMVSAVFAVVAAAPLQAQGKITTPKEFFGHNIGDDYFLPTYDQFAAYWRKIAAESPRAKLLEIGKTEEGRPQLAMIVTSPENQAKLARYKEISKKLHDAKGIDSTMARALAKEGKAVVWIDGGLHATEVVGANQLIETNYQLLSRNDDETRRILSDVIVVMVHANPDGMQMVAKQYMSNPDTLARRVGSPRLYNKYAGHDDNRDLYMSNLKESQNMNKLMYWEWDPQIMYNHHQSGPAGTVIFSPPFRDPFNYNFDPMIVMGLDMVGAAMHQRFLQEGKPGFTMRSGSSYSTWWNGGLRTTAYFQNIVGILTEIIGGPTPEQIPPVVGQMLPRGDLPAPIEPQTWHFRQSIDYSVTANYSILDLASRYKDQWLYNIWKMGSNQIARGSRDYWTISNEDIARMDSAARGGAPAGARGGRGAAAPDAGFNNPDAGGAAGAGGRGGRGGVSMDTYNAVMKDPARRDPRAFIVPSNQADFATATKFINSLRYIGVEVNRTTAPITVAGKSYPTGSYVINTAQAGRAHVMDMFMPQDHPNDFAYPGGPPVRPYDNAGWTLAYQMGVQVDPIMETVTSPSMTLIEGLAKPMAGKVTPPPASGGYMLSPTQNDAFTVVNRVLKAGGEVWRTTSPTTAGGKTYGQGSFFVAATPTTTNIINTAAAELGVDADGSAMPKSEAFQVKQHRIALWENPTGSMPSGWSRLVLERFEFPYEVICGGTLDAADARSKYDVVVLPDGAPSGAVGGGRGFGGGGRGGAGGAGGAGARPTSNDPDLAPACVPGAGSNPTGATYRKFLESGGTVIAAGTASQIGGAIGLPLKDYLVSKAPGEPDKHLAGEDYYVPGSILRAAVDTKSIAAAGMPDHIDIFYKNDPVYQLGPDAGLKGVKPVMWFDTDKPLRSGWAWGQNYLEGGTVGAEAQVGAGRLFMFSPDITFRGQPHESFKFLFNSIYSR